MEQHYSKHGDKFTALSHVSSMNTSSPKDQFLVFSSILNYQKNVSITTFSIQNHITHINFIEHGLYDPFSSENLEVNYICKYIPQSPRNCIMYFLSILQQTENYHLIKHCLQRDNPSPQMTLLMSLMEMYQYQRRKGSNHFGVYLLHHVLYLMKLVDV